MSRLQNAKPAVRPSLKARLMLSTEMGSIRVEEGPQFRPTHRQFVSEVPPQPAPAPPVATKGRPPDPELERILKMVEAGELSARDADELLRAMGRV